MSISIATWNINSVRLRAPLVQQFLQQYNPDILCLQEIKCLQQDFPYQQLQPLRPYIAVKGFKGYHGVAILSRIPFQLNHVSSKIFCGIDDGRHLCVRFYLNNRIAFDLHNFYVPAGGDIPDPQINQKFAHKLNFTRQAAHWFETMKPSHPRILVGDLNIAPLPDDVWSHKQLANVVSHTQVEIDALNQLQNSAQWIDTVRYHFPPPQKLYTWWSYRAHNWRNSDRGRRLDHLWVSPDLQPALDSVSVEKDVRDWIRPSDHVPIIARFNSNITPNNNN